MSRLTRHRSHVTYVVNLDTLSSTITSLVRTPFVLVLEAFWLVGLAFAYQSAYQCARTLIVGEEQIHRDRSSGQHRT
jgi:hypothetical protein